MLLQTNSYIVPEDRRAEHARLIRRFRQALLRIGCDQFEVYEQVGANWSPGGSSGRFVQIMRFRDRQHQQAVQTAERNDAGAQEIIAQFCDLINFPYQQQYGYFSTGFYVGLLPNPPRQTLDFEQTGAEAFEPVGEEFAEAQAQGDQEVAVEEGAGEFEESQDEFAPEPEGENGEGAIETEAETEAAADEPAGETPLTEETIAEPALDEAETDALAEGEALPEDASAVEATPGEEDSQTSAEGDVPAENAEEVESGSEIPPAAEADLPGQLTERAPATQPAAEENPDDSGAALISFLDSLTQEDLTADGSVANEVDADGHILEVDPATAEPSFADGAIALEALEPHAAELVTADEFSPAESADGLESEAELEPEAEFEAEPETEEAGVELQVEETGEEEIEFLTEEEAATADDEVSSEGVEAQSASSEHGAPGSDSLSSFHEGRRAATHIMSHAPKAEHSDSDVQHESQHDGHQPASAGGNGQNEGEENPIEFESYLREGPSADPAHR